MFEETKRFVVRCEEDYTYTDTLEEAIEEREYFVCRYGYEDRIYDIEVYDTERDTFY